MKTFTLRDGTKVLAKENGHPYHYSNRTQAYAMNTKCLAAGINSSVMHRGRPFYIKIDDLITGAAVTL